MQLCGVAIGLSVQLVSFRLKHRSKPVNAGVAGYSRSFIHFDKCHIFQERYIATDVYLALSCIIVLCFEMNYERFALKTKCASVCPSSYCF